MTTIEFSLIPDTDSNYLTVERLMVEFKNETGIDTGWREVGGMITDKIDKIT